MKTMNNLITESRQLAETMASFMRGVIEAGKEGLSVGCAQLTNQQRVMIDLAMPNEESKEAAAWFLQKLASRAEIQFVVFLADAWAVESNTKDLPPGCRVRDLPERQETLFVCIYHKQGLCDFGSWHYGRDAQGQPQFEPKMKWHAWDSKSEGLFIPPAPPFHKV